MDALIAAAIMAFGFVYAHPFEDGNGRLHRYLIHHVLAERGCNPPGVVFPVSAAILANIDRYLETLETYSEILLPHVRWEPTDEFNVRVLNDTRTFYRYFDATPPPNSCMPVSARRSNTTCHMRRTSCAGSTSSAGASRP